MSKKAILLTLLPISVASTGASTIYLTSCDKKDGFNIAATDAVVSGDGLTMSITGVCSSSNNVVLYGKDKDKFSNLHVSDGAFGVTMSSSVGVGEFDLQIKDNSKKAVSKKARILIGKRDGTNWDGYLGGTLDTYIVHQSHEAEIRAHSGFGNLYSARDLIIPWAVYDDDGGTFATVSSIGESAFANNGSGLSGTVTLPNTITNIGSEAFYRSEISSTIKIPNKLIKISDAAFYGCLNLSGIDISSATSLTTIGTDAFGYSGLTGRLDFTSSIKDIGETAFTHCEGITTLNLSHAINLENIGPGAFWHCTGLTGTLTIPQRNANIGLEAFTECENIDELDLSNFTSTPSGWGADVLTGWKQNGHYKINIAKWPEVLALQFLQSKGLPVTWTIATD